RKLRETLAGVEVVYHLAAKVTTPLADLEAHSFDQINHWGTAQVAYAAEQTGVKHLIYLSSTSVYGDYDTPVDEQAAAHPRSYYGMAKLAGEGQVLRLRDQMRVHVIRSANVYGYNPAYRIDAVINRFVFEAHFQGRVTIHGSGEQERSFIHVDKLAAVLRQLLNHEPGSQSIYNLAEHQLSINEVVAHIRQLYPELETIFLNPGMPRRNIRIQRPVALLQELKIPTIALMDELRAFQQVFSF
ncbi:MAG: SDR family oxidoreductase, partial [Bacteroidetes bacterium]